MKVESGKWRVENRNFSKNFGILFTVAKICGYYYM